MLASDFFYLQMDLVFNLCLLFEKPTFETYKFFTKLSQTSKLKVYLKNTPDFS